MFSVPQGCGMIETHLRSSHGEGLRYPSNMGSTSEAGSDIVNSIMMICKPCDRIIIINETFIVPLPLPISEGWFQDWLTEKSSSLSMEGGNMYGPMDRVAFILPHTSHLGCSVDGAHTDKLSRYLFNPHSPSKLERSEELGVWGLAPILSFKTRKGQWKY